MKKIIYLTIALLTIVFSACNTNNNEVAQTPLQISNADTTFSYFGKDGNNIEMQNSYFKTHKFEHESTTHTYVFKLQENEQIVDNKSKKQFNISPVYSNQNVLNWNLQLNPDELFFKKDVLISETFGNNEYESSYQVINLNTGNTLIEYTYGNLEIQFPDAISKRYFGVYAQKGRPNSSFPFNQKDNVAYLSYASNTEKIQTIELKTKNQELLKQLDQNSPMLEFDILENSAILSTSARTVYFSGISDLIADKNDINIGILVTFYLGEDFTPETIFIPVKADKIDEAAIIYNKNVFQLKIQ